VTIVVLAGARTASLAQGAAVAEVGPADPLADHPQLTGHARDAMRDACADHAPSCDPIAALGSLERAALRRALIERGLALDPAPTGKRIGLIHVVTLPVFGEDERLLRWANVFHVSSKEHVIARELVVRGGDRWDPDTIAESVRRLRDPLFSSLAVVVPVVPSGPISAGATVDLLVVTRDVWSLRTNYNGELQEDYFTFLTLSLSENNLWGRRKLLALVFRMDQGAFALGPAYVDKNLLGRHLDLRVRGGPLWNRATRAVEGSESSLSLSRPLWSLGTRWGVYLDWSHRDAIDRTYLGSGLRTFDAPGTPQDDALPWQYRDRAASLSLSATHSSGTAVKQNWKAGYSITSQRPTVVDDFVATPEARREFEERVLPRSERAGTAWVGYEVYTPRYRDYRDVDSYDLAESQRFGPRGQIILGVAAPFLGSERTFGTISVEGGWVIPVGQDGIASMGASFSARLEGGRLIDRGYAHSVRVMTPTVGFVRVVSEARFVGYFEEQGNRLLYVGGNNGLRGYPVGAFVGERSFVLQTELRTRSRKLLLGTRWGLVGFHDLAAAAYQLGELTPRQDVGIGLRGLVPQTSPEPFRFDLAIPIDGPDRGRPRVIAGYRQAF